MFESTQLDFAEIPSELVAYLSCLGTVIDETGKKARFSVQATMTPLVVQGCNGTFGIVNAISQTHYATILSPFVALQRILADYEFSEHGGERMWDLPQLMVGRTKTVLNLKVQEMVPEKCKKTRKNF